MKGGRELQRSAPEEGSVWSVLQKALLAAAPFVIMALLLFGLTRLR